MIDLMISTTRMKRTTWQNVGVEARLDRSEARSVRFKNVRILDVRI